MTGLNDAFGARQSGGDASGAPPGQYDPGTEVADPFWCVDFNLGDAIGSRREHRTAPSGSDGAVWQRTVLCSLLAGIAPSRARIWCDALWDEYRSLDAILRGPAVRTLPAVDGSRQALQLLNSVHHCHEELLFLDLARREQITGESAVRYLMAAIGSDETESVWALYLDSRYGLISSEAMFKGAVDECTCEPRVIAKRALDLGARAIVLAHNHPSGDTTPSFADKTITNRIARACQTLGITLVDHLIIGAGAFTSMRQKGLI